MQSTPPPSSPSQELLARPESTLAPRKIGLHPRDAAAGTHGSQGGSYKTLYTDVNGVVQELALGAAGTYYRSAGVAAAPTMAAPTPTELVGGNWKVYYSNGSGVVNELALGASGTYLGSNGTSSAPTFTAPPAGIGYFLKYKGANTVGRTSDTTLDNDPDLVFAVAANEVWLFDLVLFYLQSATNDIAVAITGPTSNFINWGLVGAEFASSNAAATLINLGGGLATGNVTGAGTVSATVMTAIGHGTIINGANAGNLQVQWGQQTSDTHAITVQKGSYLRAFKAA